MKRRKFLYAGALGASGMAIGKSHLQQDQQRSLIEWRTYRVKFGGNLSSLQQYLSEVYRPALLKKGVKGFQMMRDHGQEEPVNLYVLIEYPTAEVYLQSQLLNHDANFLKSGEDYHQRTSEQAIYNRFESWLLSGFEGMPTVASIASEHQFFELRTYEGYSEDAVRRKILMFNKEEIDLFLDVKLNPVFFGEMIAGPYRPCLTYMLQFKDLAERDANWKTFIDHPEWKRMVALPEYANTVSNIRKNFLIRA